MNIHLIIQCHHGWLPIHIQVRTHYILYKCSLYKEKATLVTSRNAELLDNANFPQVAEKWHGELRPRLQCKRVHSSITFDVVVEVVNYLFP